MSVGRDIDSQQYKQTLKSVFPTQFEPGSLADRLLIQGREEGLEKGLEKGREEGRKSALVETVSMLEDLLGEPQTEAALLANEPLAALATRVAELRQRLRDRNS